MNALVSESEADDDKSGMNSEQHPLYSDKCGSVNAKDSEISVIKTSDFRQEKNERTFENDVPLSNVDSRGMNEIHGHEARQNEFVKQNDTVSTTFASHVAPVERASRLPIAFGRKLAIASMKNTKLILEKRKPRDIHIPTSPERPTHSASMVSRPKSSRFPKVSVPLPFRPRASTVGPSGFGAPPARALQTSLPPIRTTDGAVCGIGRGRSRIPVRARSADCQTGHQAARRSHRLTARSNSCGSDDARQVSGRSRQRSARSSSCSSNSARQAARRLAHRSARSSSYDSAASRQVAGRSGKRSARPNSCGSAGGQERASDQATATSNWSLIDVNDNARLLLHEQTTAVLEHDFITRRRADLIILQHEHDHDKQNTPTLPRVTKLKQHWENAAGSGSAMSGSTIRVRSPRHNNVPSSPSANGGRSGASRRQRKTISEQAAGTAPSTVADRAAGQHSIRRAPGGGGASQRTPGSSGTSQKTPGSSGPSQRTPGSSGPFQKTPRGSGTSQRTLGGGGTSRRVPDAGVSRAGVPAARSPSPRVSGVARRPPVEYRPNLTPYPRQYILLGLLGPDPERIKRRQDKMRRQWEYVEKLAMWNRAAAQRRQVVPLRVCPADPHQTEHNPEHTIIQNSLVTQSASDECVMSTDVTEEPAVAPPNDEHQISTTEERRVPLPDELQTTEERGGETLSQEEHCNSVRSGGTDDVSAADSDANSVSESMSESSFDWGPDQTLLGTRESEVLSDENGELKGMETRAAPEDSAVCIASNVDAMTEEEKAPEEKDHQLAEVGKERYDSNKEEDQPPKLELMPLETEMPTVKAEALSGKMTEDYPNLEELKEGNEIQTATEDNKNLSITYLESQSPAPESTTPACLTLGSVWARSGEADKCLAWLETFASLATSSLVSTEDLKQNASFNEPDLQDSDNVKSAHRTQNMYTESSRSSVIAPEADESDSDDFDSAPKSVSSSDSDAEMADALEELSVETLCPDRAADPPAPSPMSPPTPPVPLDINVTNASGPQEDTDSQEDTNGPHDDASGPREDPVGSSGEDEGRGEGGCGWGVGGCDGQSARRCASDDLFLELSEQTSVRVTSGRCRGASGGCSCELTSRRPAAFHRSTQVPRDPTSFVYKNLLVMDLGEEATGPMATAGSELSEGSGEAEASGVAEAGPPEAGAESEPVPVGAVIVSAPGQRQDGGPIRRRRWGSRLWPSYLPDQPPTRTVCLSSPWFEEVHYASDKTPEHRSAGSEDL